MLVCWCRGEGKNHVDGEGDFLYTRQGGPGNIGWSKKRPTFEETEDDNDIERL